MRLLLADDHTLFRDALMEYVQRAIPAADVVLARDFFEAFDIMEKDEDFDLIMLDLHMPGMKGMDGLEWILEGFPDQNVALISGLADDEDVRKAMEMGVEAYFPKTMSGKAMVQAIQVVLSGQRYMPLDHKGADIMPSHHPQTYARPDRFDGEDELIENFTIPGSNEAGLTPREKDVLGFLVKGASNKEIARDLSLQVVTVKLHVRGICRKLGVQNRTQAALKALELGYR